MERWEGKIAIVTGASAGIGAATAISLVNHGFQVIAVARRVEKVEALKNQVQNAKGKLIPKRADVSNEEDITALFQWVKETFGTVHILINNAGVTRYGKVTAQSPKYWRQIFDTNVLGLGICSQQAVQLMRDTGVDDGHIILIGSVLGHVIPNMPDPILGMYPASKYAVKALTETLRQELRFLKTKIRVSHLSPGVVRTEFGDAANAAMEEHERMDMYSRSSATEATPILESEDIAEGIVYILSTPPHVQVHELTIKPTGSYF